VCVSVFVRLCLLEIEVRSQNEEMSDLNNAKKNGGQKGPLKYHRPEEEKIRGTVVQLLWRAAASPSACCAPKAESSGEDPRATGGLVSDHFSIMGEIGPFFFLLHFFSLSHVEQG